MKGLDPDLRSLQEMRDLVARARAACAEVSGYDQARIDGLCKAMAEAGAAAAFDLARLAVEETGIGCVHYKVLKNLLGSEGVWDSIKGEKTVGIVSRDETAGVYEVATPVGVVAAVIPTTNPTSTALYKCLISVKGRNAVVISPHPRAKRCIAETVDVMRRAIERAGGPPDLCSCITSPTIETTGALMKHRDVAIILSTGGSGLVKAAYSSGKPAYGVGPGNVPAYVDRSADIARVAADLVGSQSFDNGTLCCSEQAIVADRPIVDKLLAALKERGAHVCDEEQTAKLGRLCNKGGLMNADVVGLDPWRVAEMAGFHVPAHTSLLLAHQGGVGEDWPLSIEILCPLLSVHTVDGWQEGCKVCKEVLHHGGLGHTMAVHARDAAVLEAFFLEKPASRICANGPTSQGAVGFSTNLVPAMSLGCGPQAGNITSDNITARHLVNYKRVAFPRKDWPEIERRYHERAARLTGEAAPRGSGLPGDPALAASAPRTATRSDAGEGWSIASNWRGNPPVSPAPERGAPATLRPKVRPALKASPAPKFTRPAAVTSAVLPLPANPKPAASRGKPGNPAVARAANEPATLHATHEVGASLSVGEIQTIMSHAGAGCPLGPCRGCPHNDVRTGACTA